MSDWPDSMLGWIRGELGELSRARRSGQEEEERASRSRRQTGRETGRRTQNGRLKRWLRWVNCGTKYFTSHAALGEKTPNLDCPVQVCREVPRYMRTCPVVGILDCGSHKSPRDHKG